MSNVPQGAQLSDDGQWWWDGQQWQPVSPQPQPQGGAASGADPADRSAARVAQGMPASINDLTDENRSGYVGEAAVEVEAVNAEQVEVLAMQDTGTDGGEATA